MWTRSGGVVLGAIAIGVATVSASSSSASEARVAAAAEAAIARYTEWLGPPALSAAEAPLARTDSNGVTALRGWSAPLTMDVEAAAVHDVGMRWWRWPPDDASSEQFFSALSWYLQGRVIEPLNDLWHSRSGHSAAGMRVFGGDVPWAFPMLHLDRFTAARSLAPDAARGALAFATVERYIGWPALQGSLRVLAERAAQAPVSRAEAITILSDAAGQDLTWLLPMFERQFAYDYSVGDVAVEPGRTRVIVHRRGATFVARQGVEVRVTFEDGQQASARWDGRADSHTVEFQSASAPAIVEIDPHRILQLDAKPLNNRVSIGPRRATPITKWAASWAVWLQDATLTYSFLF
jgi:hypothetical protein